MSVIIKILDRKANVIEIPVQESIQTCNLMLNDLDTGERSYGRKEYSKFCQFTDLDGAEMLIQKSYIFQVVEKKK